MFDLMRSYSMPVRSTPFQLDVEIDDFLDDHGVIRRASAASPSASRSLLRGDSDPTTLFLSVSTPIAPANTALLESTSEPIDGATDQQLDETTDQRAEARRQHRARLIVTRRERKRELLDAQCARIHERLSLWYETSELDPDVETSRQHTLLSPSNRTQSYIDADGNIRRKRLCSVVDASTTSSSQTEFNDQPSMSLPPSPSRAQASAHKSLVWEFVQTLIDD